MSSVFWLRGSEGAKGGVEFDGVAVAGDTGLKLIVIEDEMAPKGGGDMASVALVEDPVGKDSMKKGATRGSEREGSSQKVFFFRS